MRPTARSRGHVGGCREQGRAEPQDRHRRRQPQRPGQVRRRLMRCQPGHPQAAPQPPRDRLQRRQAVATADPAPASGRAASSCDTRGSRPASCSRSTEAREENRDRHDLAVDAGTCRRRPGTRSHGRAAARPAAAACAASTSTARITAAPYRRRDHRSAGRRTCVRPQARHRDRRGRNSSQPPGIATRRHRAYPHGPSTPPHGHRSFPASSRDSALSAEPRTVTTRCHLRHQLLPGGLPRNPARRSRGGPLPRLHGHGDAVHHPASRESPR
jgi:hypothetical protein